MEEETMSIEEAVNIIANAVIRMSEQYEADMEAIRHELEAVWEAVNELQGIDPERAGEPDAVK